jgi:hypothetical protein
MLSNRSINTYRGNGYPSGDRGHFGNGVPYVVRSETIKREPMGSSNSKLQTRPLVREGATKYHTCNCPKKITRRKKNW